MKKLYIFRRTEGVKPLNTRVHISSLFLFVFKDSPLFFFGGCFFSAIEIAYKIKLLLLFDHCKNLNCVVNTWMMGRKWAMSVKIMELPFYYISGQQKKKKKRRQKHQMKGGKAIGCRVFIQNDRKKKACHSINIYVQFLCARITVV